MTPERELIIFTDNGKSTYVAPDCSVIAVRVCLVGWDRGEVSNPFLINEPNMNYRSWSERVGTEYFFELGRYLHAQELENVKSEIEELLSNRELNDEDVLDEIQHIEKEIMVEFNAPSEPYYIFADRPELEEQIHPDTSDEEIALIAIEAAEQTIPYMHPWEAYQFLLDLKDNWPTEY
jgi:hypothetical protein